MTTYEPTREDLVDYAACRESQDREELNVCTVCSLPESQHDGTELHRFVESHRPGRIANKDENEISMGDKVTMKVRPGGFYDGETVRIVRIHSVRRSGCQDIFVESLDGERYGWTSISNLTLYHG